jgi:hypothetical protein
MTNHQENPGAQRTRRNIMKAVPMLASALAVTLATTKVAVAGQNDRGKTTTTKGKTADRVRCVS